MVAAPLVVGGGALALWWLPKLVREQVVERLQQRSGLPAQVSDVSLGLFSIDVGEVVLGKDPRGPSMTAKRIAIGTSPVMLAIRGGRAMQNVRIGELTLRIPTQSVASRTSLATLLSKAESQASTTSAAPTSMTLQIDRMAVALSDARGTLLAISGGKVRSDGQSATLDIAQMALGSKGESELALRNVAIGVKRGAAGWQLASANVRELSCFLGESNADATPTTWQRVLDVADWIGAARAAAPAKTTGAAAAAVPLARIADGAVLSLARASVHAQRETQPILHSVQGSAKMQRDRALSLTGSGKAQSGGSLDIDLVLRLAQLQADGRVQLKALPLDLLAPLLPAIPWHEPEHGRIDAQLVVKTDESQAVSFSGDISLRDAALASPRLAPNPIRDLNVTLRGAGRFLPLQHRLEIAQSQLLLSGAALDLHGAVEWSPDHYLFDIDARLPPTPCTEAVRSIPEGLLGDLSLATWHGKISGNIRTQIDSRALDELVLEIKPEVNCEFVSVPAMADLRRFHDVFVHSVEEPDGSMFEMETGPGTPVWTYLEDISPYFVHAILAHEDGGFFTHKGFSPRHIRDALARNLKEGRYVVGASTITMQLVKNIFLHREKTLGRKIQEVLLTWWIERVMEKRDILELYFNVIEYGPGVYGIRNGARHYFNRMPSQLSPAESVYLATILPNPKRYHAAFERGSVSPAWTEIMRKLLVRLGERGSYSPEAVMYGQKELSAFRFVPEGTLVAPRSLMGETAPLPYERSFAGDADWSDDADVELLELDDTSPLPSPAPPP